MEVGGLMEGGRTALTRAVENGRVEAARLLVTECGADVNQLVTVDGVDRTPLSLAAIKGHAEMARMLVLEGGANVEKGRIDNGATPLGTAAHRGHTDIVRMLLFECKADVNKGHDWTMPLHLAAQEGHAEVVRILLERGADVTKATGREGLTPLGIAAYRGRTAIVRILLEHGAEVNEGTASHSDRCTPLHFAIGHERTDIVRILLEHGADVEEATREDGDFVDTPLVIAARHDYPEIVRILLERGADVNKATSGGSTALHIASDAGRTDIVRILLEAGADVHTAVKKDTHGRVHHDIGAGYTPLHCAADYGRLQIARILLEAGADVNKTTEDEFRTPLYGAAETGHPGLVRMFVFEFKAADVHTPLIIAATHGRTEVVRILVVECGARVDQPDNSGWRPLHHAAEGDGDEMDIRETCFSLCALGADMDLSLPEGQDPLTINDQTLADWLDVAGGFGCSLKVAFERRDYDAAIYLLRNRLVDVPTANLIREELLPIASTVGEHALALPVCQKTRRVAEAALELWSNRWSQKLHVLCGEGQRDAVTAVLTIMRRTGRGTRSRGDDEDANPHEQVGKLPRWMHSVIDDVWWKVLEMMGIW